MAVERHPERFKVGDRVVFIDRIFKKFKLGPEDVFTVTWAEGDTIVFRDRHGLGSTPFRASLFERWTSTPKEEPK